MAGQSKMASPPKTISDMALDLLFTLWGAQHGRVLLFMWGSFPFLIGALAIRKYFLRKSSSSEDKKQEKPSSSSSSSSSSSTKKEEEKGEQKKKKKMSFQEKLIRLLRVIFSHAGGKSALFIVLYTLILCSRVWLTLRLAQLVGGLGSMMGRRDFKSMFLLQGWYSLTCYPAAMANSLMTFFERRIAIQFRSDLSKSILDKYLNDNTFYKMISSQELKNVDQMVSVDVAEFCEALTHIYGHLLKPILDIIVISHTLARKLGLAQLLSFFAFFFINNFLLSIAKPNLSRMVIEQRKLEASYQTDHSRISHFFEEIAFVDGEAREREIFEGSLDKLVDHGSKSLFVHFWKDLLDSYVLKYGGSMMAYTIIIPSVYCNWAGVSGHDATQHYLEATTLLLGLGNAVKDIMTSYKETAKLSGLTDRVWSVWSAVSSASGKDQIQYTGTVERDPSYNFIEFINCDVVTPFRPKEESEKEKAEEETKGEGMVLVHDLNLRVGPGEHLLVRGPNGIGKSSLFRVMAGLWPLSAGKIKLPPKEMLYFISQNAYMVPGTLADQLTYPEHLDQITPEKENELVKLLEMVNLQNILSRYSLQSTEEWQSVLSGGEKQRLVIARLYYHKPSYGILDECTSQVSLDMQQRVFQQAKELGITLITIAHNEALRPLHHVELSLHGGGEWNVTYIET